MKFSTCTGVPLKSLGLEAKTTLAVAIVGGFSNSRLGEVGFRFGGGGDGCCGGGGGEFLGGTDRKRDAIVSRSCWSREGDGCHCHSREADRGLCSSSASCCSSVSCSDAQILLCDNDLALGLGYGAIRVCQPLQEEEDVVANQIPRWYRCQGRNQYSKSQQLDKHWSTLRCLICKVDGDTPNDGRNWGRITYTTRLIQENLWKRWMDMRWWHDDIIRNAHYHQ